MHWNYFNKNYQDFMVQPKPVSDLEIKIKELLKFVLIFRWESWHLLNFGQKVNKHLNPIKDTQNEILFKKNLVL